MLNRMARHRAAIAFSAVITCCLALLVGFAVAVLGYPAHHAELNDGGVWVSNDAIGYLGRMNKPVSQLDGGLYSPGGENSDFNLDLVQSGPTLIAWDKAGGRLLPVNTTSLKAPIASDAAKVDDGAQVGLAGGVLAVLNGSTGELWAMHVDGQAGSLAEVDASAPPLLKRTGVGAGLAVGTDGTIYVVGSGALTSIGTSDSGMFDKPVITALSPAPTGPLTITAVGRQPVILAAGPAGGATVIVPGHGSVPITGTGATLQQPGLSSSSVLVASASGLQSVSLRQPAARALVAGVAGVPAAPVELGGCLFAAWAGSTSTVATSCGGAPSAVRQLGKPTQNLVFRVNRGQLLLNDTRSGMVFNVDTGSPHQIDNWNTILQSSRPAQSNPHNNQNAGTTTKSQPPTALADTLGARPGRTTALYVLDNDKDPTGNILSIQSVTGLTDHRAQLSVDPDGQTVDINLPADLHDPSIGFDYVVGDGANPTATAHVTVNVVAPDQYFAPNTRAGYVARQWHVPAGGQIAIPALADWRNYGDGDLPVLRRASVGSLIDGSVGATPDGQLIYTAPATPGVRTINYQVGDGTAQSRGDRLTIDVQASTDTASWPAVAQPDYAHGQVSNPIVLHPLANDLPGSDPRSPSAVLALAGRLVSPSGTKVATDLSAGTVTLIAQRPGNYALTYQAAYGNARYALGKIRVNVVPSSAGSQPVTVPVSAVVYGQQPATVDVLAADSDPSGGLLTVQDAKAGSQLQVAVLDGRWLRINARSASLSPGTQVVGYTVTNGVSGPVRGQVIVTQLPMPADQAPITTPDYATVRAGDSVTIPVLDNDTDLTGAELSLRQSLPGSGVRAGRLPVTPATGMAFVSGNLVRFVAPPASAVTEPTQVTIDYIAQDDIGQSARGQAIVTITPAPSATNPDQAPDPQPVEARVVAGDTATIQIPVSGVDPDGDTVTVTGIGSAPALGRVLSIGATSITYQAYPAASNGGTDTFSYLVDDGHHLSGTASIRIAVVPPGLPQPPIAKDIALSAGPTTAIEIDALSHVIRSPDDQVTISPLSMTNPGTMPGNAKLIGPQGPIELTTNGLTGKPVVLRYQVTDGTGSSVGTITIRSEAGAVLPPVAHDQYAKAGQVAGTVSVNVLKNAYDPSGGRLSVSYPTTGVSGGQVTVRTANVPQVVPYVITSSSGASATALIFVPPVGAGPPRLKTTTPLQLAVNASKTISLSDYVEDPTPGKQLRLTTKDRAWASPTAGLLVKVTGVATLTIVSQHSYQGPGAVTFEVTDGATVSDPNGRLSIVTLPVQVGSPTPVLRCPADQIPLVEGGNSVPVDIAVVCHAWTPNPADAGRLRFTGSWAKDPGHVQIDGNGSTRISLTAEGAATPGSTGVVTVGVQGAASVPAKLNVVITSAPPPSMALVTVDGVRAGDSKTIDLTGYLTSALRDPRFSVVGQPVQVAGGPAQITASGSKVTIAPGKDSKGSMTFRVQVTDVADTSRSDRAVAGQIVLNVLGHPDPPMAPVPGNTVLSKTVQLNWTPPADNGAPILYYLVKYGSGSQRCPTSSCAITGLTNGATYHFTVTAYNLVGASPDSPPSGAARPDQVPDPVTNFITSNPADHSLQLTWQAAHVDGTPVTNYLISWGNGGTATVGAVTSYRATGLDNDTPYVFTIQAENAKGFSKKASTRSSYPAGKPISDPPAAPTFTAVTDADGKTRDVTVNWTAEDPNGEGPVTYTVQRTDNHGGSKLVCTVPAQTSCSDSGLNNDGTLYTYQVAAANAAAALAPAAHTTGYSPGARMEATSTPDPIPPFSLSPTGADGQATITFDAPASHGASSTVSCTANGSPCGNWNPNFSPDGQSGVTQTITGLSNGANTTIALQDCNGSGSNADQYSGQPCDAMQSGQVTPYGPIQGLVVNLQKSGDSITWTVSVDPRGKPVNLRLTSTHGLNWTGTTGTGYSSYSGQERVGYSTTVTYQAVATDTAGNPQRGSQNASNSTTTDPPPASISLQQGASTVQSGCATNCYQFAFQVHNFATGSFGYTCSNSTGAFYSNTIRINNPNQSFSSGYCWEQSGYNMPVTITINGITSNQASW